MTELFINNKPIFYLLGVFSIMWAAIFLLRFLFSYWLEATKGNKFLSLGFLSVGTIVHELSHAAMCLIFFIRINKIVLFSPQTDKDGLTMGYICYSAEKTFLHAIGKFFVGIAPLVGNIAAALFLFNMTDIDAESSVSKIASSLQATDLFLLAASVSLTIAAGPSQSDMQKSSAHFILISAIIIVFIGFFPDINLPERIFEFVLNAAKEVLFLFVLSLIFIILIQLLNGIAGMREKSRRSGRDE